MEDGPDPLAPVQLSAHAGRLHRERGGVLATLPVPILDRLAGVRWSDWAGAGIKAHLDEYLGRGSNGVTPVFRGLRLRHWAWSVALGLLYFGLQAVCAPVIAPCSRAPLAQ